MNNKDRAVEFIDYLWNNGDESVLGTYLAADFKMHRPLTDRYGCDREAFRKWFRYVVNFSLIFALHLTTSTSQETL